MSNRLLMSGCLLIAVLTTTCKLEPCKDYACVNGEPQEDFDRCICICNSGWDGVDCTVEDKCVTMNVQCVNGYCVKSTGLCVCDAGFEGDSCQFRSRDRFLDGNDTSYWKFSDTCSLSQFNDTLFIRPASLSSSLEIFNVRNLDATLMVPVIVNKFTFEQRVSAGINSVTISSLNGTLSEDLQRISVTYLSNSTFCTGTWHRLP